MEKHDASCCPYILIRKSLVLLESNIPTNDNRIIKILNEFLKCTGSSYWLQDLDPLMRVLELIVINHLENPDYDQVLKLLLKKCVCLPMLTKTSDILTYSREFAEYFSVLGFLLVYVSSKNMTTMQTAISEVFKHLFERNESCFTKQTEPSKEVKERETKRENMVSLEACVAAIERSRLPEILGQLLDIVGEKSFEHLINFCIHLISYSNECCERLLKMDALNSVLVRLEPTWRERFPSTEPPELTDSSTPQHYSIISDITWKFMNCISKNSELTKILKIPKVFTLWSIKWAIWFFIKRHNKNVDRNNILAITLNLVKYFPSLSFVNSGLGLEIVELNNLCDIPGKHFSLSNTHEDFEFRKMLLLFLPYLIREGPRIKLLIERKIIRILLLNVSGKQYVQWHQIYMNQLLVLIQNIFRLLVSIDHNELREEFIEHNGPQITMNLVNQSSKYLESGVLEACLGFLSHVAYSGMFFIVETCLYLDKLDKYTEFAIKILRQPKLTINDLKILQVIFALLADVIHFVKGDIKTMHVCIAYLARYLHPETQDNVHDPRVMICAIRLLWVNVHLDREVERFIKHEGVFYLLDVLEDTIYPVKIGILGVLVDLCESGICIPHLLTWRKNGKKILPLLMEIYREESQKLGVATGPNGEIDDLDNPIMGVQQKLETHCECEDKKFTSPVISEMFGSCRPKIYAILQYIHKHHENITELTNEVYKLFNDDLSVQDQITMIVADKYLDLKVVETWRELETELQQKHFKCFYSDQVMLRTINERNRKWALRLQIAQKECIRRQREKDMIEEYNFYQELKDAKLQSSLEALKELKKDARVSQDLFRRSAKLKQNLQIESTAVCPGKATFQTTHMYDLNVTPVFEMNVTIEDDDANEDDSEYELVSPVESLQTMPACCDNDTSEGLDIEEETDSK